MKLSFAPLDPDAVDFLSEETGIDYRSVDFTQPHWFCVTKRRDDGTLMGVCACEFKTWFDVHFSTAVADPAFMSQRLLHTIFSTLFSQAIRITALISPDNQRAINGARRLGFVYEGFSRRGVEGRRDALIFGMLREDCRFLPGRTRPRPTFTHTMLFGDAPHGLHS